MQTEYAAAVRKLQPSTGIGILRSCTPSLVVNPRCGSPEGTEK